MAGLYHGDSVILKGVDGLLSQIAGHIPDVFFSWTAGTNGIDPIMYMVQGYTFRFSKVAVSAPGQRPPHIGYKLDCTNNRAALYVYVEWPQQESARAVRLATWAAFRAFLDLPNTTYMQSIDARAFRWAAQAQAQAQAQPQAATQ
ncbi:hypothetical protein OH76DRAFT_1411046 [Lentinus brumalis]|uniref:Uncharacterized protein n=1 Tax=Lentinus brumalis TaxID=2498619 RepID=A0A371CQK2_9APHY|nr:hypothetical protein OH76DRAFT_1411046 [Polyporus brumalis]